MSEKKILIVDDDQVNIKLIKILLSADKYTIETANDAEQALSILTSFHPQLILMDIGLPGMNGLELTKRIKSDSKIKDILILALTGYSTQDDIKAAKASGCTDIIIKPIDIETFPGIIRRYFTINAESS